MQAHLITRIKEALKLVDEGAKEEEPNLTRAFDSDEIVQFAEFFRELTETEEEGIGFREGFGTGSNCLV